MRTWVFPGQGSQRRGMGAEVFARYPEPAERASNLLGYSLPELCERDPDNRLRQTRFAQPALFVVNALTQLARLETGPGPDILAGHSLGEYNALCAAGAFDFDTGVRLVQERGELMARASGGGMVAVLGLTADRVAGLLAEHGAHEVDIANYNEPEQVVLSGPQDALREIAKAIGDRPGVRCVPLNVSAPFHSRYMAAAAEKFRHFLADFAFADPRIPVVSNVTARPYEPGRIAELLAQQISSPVRWWDTVCYLRERGVTELAEVGPGSVLTRIWQNAPQVSAPVAARVVRVAPPQVSAPVAARVVRVAPSQVSTPVGARVVRVAPERLGSAEFRRDYGVRYAYLAGSMYQGIASADMVIRMGRAGLMGFFGAGGLTVQEVDEAIGTIQRELGPDGRYGANLLYTLDDGRWENAIADLYLRRGVRYIEAAGYTRITAPLVRLRFTGARRDGAGRPSAGTFVVAKVSRPETAEAFLSPPPESLLDTLVSDGQLTPEEARIARELPVSDDICVEADSGGHTDAGVALTLVPSIIRLRDAVAARYGYQKIPRVGTAGGIGAPEAVAAAFVLGADFVLTGSVNQCSPQSGTSPEVKDILAGLDVQDTTYAPAGDMFELGARVQVVRSGTLFAARANRLYQLYRQHDSLDELDPKTRQTLEETYFRRTFAQVWDETRQYMARHRPEELARAERNPKHRMALVFRWYFVHSSRMALRGVAEERVNFQIHSGPAIGAFNRFVAGTDLADWRHRHVDVIAERLMHGGAELLSARLEQFTEGEHA